MVENPGTHREDCKLTKNEGIHPVNKPPLASNRRTTRSVILTSRQRLPIPHKTSTMGGSQGSRSEEKHLDKGKAMDKDKDKMDLSQGASGVSRSEFEELRDGFNEFRLTLDDRLALAFTRATQRQAQGKEPLLTQHTPDMAGLAAQLPSPVGEEAQNSLASLDDKMRKLRLEAQSKEAEYQRLATERDRVRNQLSAGSIPEFDPHASLSPGRLDTLFGSGQVSSFNEHGFTKTPDLPKYEEGPVIAWVLDIDQLLQSGQLSTYQISKRVPAAMRGDLAFYRRLLDPAEFAGLSTWQAWRRWILSHCITAETKAQARSKLGSRQYNPQQGLVDLFDQTYTDMLTVRVQDDGSVSRILIDDVSREVENALPPALRAVFRLQVTGKRLLGSLDRASLRTICVDLEGAWQVQRRQGYGGTFRGTQGTTSTRAGALTQSNASSTLHNLKQSAHASGSASRPSGFNGSRRDGTHRGSQGARPQEGRDQLRSRTYAAEPSADQDDDGSAAPEASSKTDEAKEAFACMPVEEGIEDWLSQGIFTAEPADQALQKQAITTVPHPMEKVPAKCQPIPANACQCLQVPDRLALHRNLMGI